MIQISKKHVNGAARTLFIAYNKMRGIMRGCLLEEISKLLAKDLLRTAIPEATGVQSSTQCAQNAEHEVEGECTPVLTCMDLGVEFWP